MGSSKQARRNAIFVRDHFRCVYCAQIFQPQDLTLDHVEPTTKQGDHSDGNLVTACQACNRQKGGRAAWQWLRAHPFERDNFLRYATHVWPRLRRAVEDATPEDLPPSA